MEESQESVVQDPNGVRVLLCSSSQGRGKWKNTWAQGPDDGLQTILFGSSVGPGDLRAIAVDKLWAGEGHMHYK